MSEGSVVYSDVKFKSPKRTEGRDDAKASTSNEATYSEVRIPEPQRSQPSKDPHKSNGGSKVKSGGFDPVRVVLAVLCVLLAAVVIVLTVLLDKEKRDFIRWRANHSLPSCPPSTAWNFTTGCPHCPRDWEHHGGRCYYFSTDKLNWNQSRNDCISRGGHLAIINSTEEQIFLNKNAITKVEGDEKFWIGLTDERQENVWLWVDDSTPTESYWFVKNEKEEPDNWRGKAEDHPEGEDCVRLGENSDGFELKSWFDYFCDNTQRRICETKAIEP